MTWEERTTDIEVSEHRVQRRPVSQVCIRRFCTPPSCVSGLLLLCSAIFQDCRAGVLTNNHEAQK